ncbi:copper ion transmembrane transporter [Tanacetum coccineum]
MKDETRGRLIQKAKLERPWEVVEKDPKLFSVTANEQLKVLADQFQKPGGFDLWFEKDGLQSFETVEGIPSASFSLKGLFIALNLMVESATGFVRENGYDDNSINATRKYMNKDGRRKIHSGLDSCGIGSNHRESKRDWRKDSKRGNSRKEKLGLESKVLDINLQDDESYEILKKEMEIDIVFPRPKDVEADKYSHSKAVFMRPYLDDFLSFCFNKFNVGIWSSRMKYYLV